MPELDLDRFRETLGVFPTGVAIVSALDQEGAAGFTCQSFNSLSLEPMLCVFAANTQGRSWARIRSVGHVGISILREDQESLARHFAASRADKFTDVAWHAAPNGAPWLDGAIGFVSGEISSVETHGDHELVVVRVSHVATSPGKPLVYHRGGFGQLS